MEFRPIPCHESLRPFIRNYWLLTAHCTATGTQQIFSNGAASLQFYLSQPVRLTTSPMQSGETKYRTILFHQNMQTVGVTCEEGDFYIFGAEFVPFCSRVFFRPPLQMERTGGKAYSSPEELGDEGFVELSRRIYAAEGTEERVQLLDEFFLKRLAEFPEGDVNIERLGDVFDEVVPTDGSVPRPPHCQDEFSPADLASTACLSQKQFTRVFNKYVGMNPKSYLRLLRFHRALQMLRATPPAATPAAPRAEGAESSTSNNPSAGEVSSSPRPGGLRGGVGVGRVASSCGYCDLPHMISDFRDICGYSPSELVSTGAELTETFGQQFSGLMKKKIKIENLV